MVTIESSPTQLPQPPNPPVVAKEALSKLVQYYQELAFYHRSLVDRYQQLLEQHISEAKVAETQLASIEAILSPLTAHSQKIADTILNPTTTTEEIADQTSPLESGINGNGQQPKEEESQLVTTKLEKKVPNQAEEKIAIGVKHPESATSDTPELPKTKTETTASNTKAIKTVKNNSTKSKQVAKTTKEKTTTRDKKVAKSSSNLPVSQKLDQYDTIGIAVRAYLKERSPEVVTAADVVHYFYPDGLDASNRKKAQASFSTCLSKGAGKQGWVRTSVGRYAWDS
ncbi:conserved hypothetical protein [Hyella patelloides LEGE 07179]|uniref:Uncharacterized protein n=1 Tax=Hyella patelloides LEGE 07179 TaxID=945734 RepID=A0A563VQ51_9CYAN|nr:hypothetical protein [Hyella patelloides]VEP13553.1 conserved hypothetical protein [Hyella patelloides LEGE 07179]